MSSKKKRTLWQWVVRVIAGYEIAIVSMILLTLIILFSTLEQAEIGLYSVGKRYYEIDVLFVQPELKGRELYIILPGAYWVCAIFTLNLIAGGIVKMFTGLVKGQPTGAQLKDRFLKKGGIFVSHMSMAALMIAGAVDYHTSTTTLLAVKEGESNNIGSEANDIVIEVGEIQGNAFTNIHEIQNNQIGNMILNRGNSIFNSRPDKKLFSFDEFPFTLEFNGWYKNSTIHTSKEARQEGDGEIVNGFFIRPQEILSESKVERLTRRASQGRRLKVLPYNLGSAYFTVIPKDGSEPFQMIMWANPSYERVAPVGVNIGGKSYGFKLTSHRTILPFTLYLEKLDVIKYQGSERAREYNSRVVYNSDSVTQRSSRIEMNDPLREEGYAIYQSSLQFAEDEKGREEYLRQHADKEKELNKKIPLKFKREHQRTSVYQIVSNPADQWPAYCLYVCALALGFHFCVKLFFYINLNTQKKETNG